MESLRRQGLASTPCPTASFLNKVNGVQLFIKVTHSAALGLIFLASFGLAGCFSIQSAYKSSVDAVSS
jgi:hypothetical protein